MVSCHSIAILCDLRLAAQSRDSRARAMAHTTQQTRGSAVDCWPHVGVRNAAPQLVADGSRSRSRCGVSVIDHMIK